MYLYLILSIVNKGNMLILSLNYFYEMLVQQQKLIFLEDDDNSVAVNSQESSVGSSLLLPAMQYNQFRWDQGSNSMCSVATVVNSQEFRRHSVYDALSLTHTQRRMVGGF